MNKNLALGILLAPLAALVLVLLNAKVIFRFTVHTQLDSPKKEILHVIQKLIEMYLATGCSKPMMVGIVHISGVQLGGGKGCTAPPEAPRGLQCPPPLGNLDLE